ncbi:hypothetical protein [Kitasatospora sp. NPDC050463]|uniref:hypothetical protein n=1 Tax=Kitasatospora sp. NPDC050463 TaxID=3155786 RepID=UPI0033CC810D
MTGWLIFFIVVGVVGFGIKAVLGQGDKRRKSRYRGGDGGSSNSGGGCGGGGCGGGGCGGGCGGS